MINDLEMSIIPKFKLDGIKRCIDALGLDIYSFATFYAMELENKGLIPNLPFAYFSYKNTCRIIQDIFNNPNIDVNDYDEVGIILKKYLERKPPQDMTIDNRDLKDRDFTEEELNNLRKFVSK